MVSIELITCLPSALSCTIMQDWLSLKSVVALDSAYCCHSHRITFLNLVRSDEYHIHEQITIEIQSKILSVLHLYGEKLRSVVIRSGVLPVQEELLVQNCRNLTHVRFQGLDTCTHEFLRIMNHGIILVDLYYINFTKFEPLQIPLCPNLISLGLGNTRLNSNSLSKFICSCPSVVHLDVSRNSELVDADVLRIVTHWKFLRGINIESCITLTDASLMHIYTHCASTLHTLQMNCRMEDHGHLVHTFQPLLSLTAISELLEHCTHLRTFRIQGSRLDGDAGKIQLPPTALRNITTLISKNFVRIATTNDSSMSLQTLAASEYYPWESLVNLVRSCPNLTEVYLDIYAYRAIENFESLSNAVKTIKPGLQIKPLATWKSYKKHLVMNM